MLNSFRPLIISCLPQLEPGALLSCSVHIKCWGGGESKAELILTRASGGMTPVFRRLEGVSNTNSCDL